MSKRAGSLLMVLGLLLLLSAAAIAGYNIWDSNRAAESSRSIALQLTEQIPEVSGTDTNHAALDVTEQGNVILPEQEVPGH